MSDEPNDIAGQWRPTDDRVLIDLEPTEEVRASGLVVPKDASSTKVRYAVVRSVGREAMRDVSVGDRVVVSGYAGTSLPGSDTERLVRVGDLLAVIG